MSSDLVKRLRGWKAGASDDSRRMVWEMYAAADRIEALEGEVAAAKSSAAKFNDGWGESIEISRKNYAAWKEAEERAERLRVALRAIEQADYYGCVSEFAAKALEDDKK